MDPYTLNLLGALAVGCNDRQEAALATVGLAPAELVAVLAVFTRPGSTIGAIARTTGLTHSGAVRVIDRLEAAGRVERRVGRDRRTVAIHCTPEGARTSQEALACREHTLRGLTDGLTPGEIASLRRIAQKLLAGLPRARADAWRICRLCDHGVCRGSDCPTGSAVP